MRRLTSEANSSWKLFMHNANTHHSDNWNVSRNPNKWENWSSSYIWVTFINWRISIRIKIDFLKVDTVVFNEFKFNRKIILSSFLILMLFQNELIVIVTVTQE